MTRCRCRTGLRDRGSTTVEVAVLVLPMLLLTMAVVQAGIWFHTRAVMTTAANQGLDAARVDQGTEMDGRRAAEHFLGNTGALQESTVEVERGTDTATVQISGRVASLVDVIPLPITVTAEAPVEQVTP